MRSKKIILCVICAAEIAAAPARAQSPAADPDTDAETTRTATFTAGAGGTYSDINAAVAAICAGAKGAVTGGCPGGTQKKNIVIQVAAGGVTTSTLQSIAGWTAGSFKTRLQPDKSGGFRAYLNAEPRNPLYFNTAYGSFILQTGYHDILDVDVNNFTMFGMQLENSSGGDSFVGMSLGTNAVAVTLDSNIIVSSGTTHSYPDVFFAANGTPLVKNNVIVGLNKFDSLDMIASSNIDAYYNTFIMAGPTTANQGAALLADGSGTITVRNNLALGFGWCGNGGVPGGNNTGFGFGWNGGGAMPTVIASNNATCFPRFNFNGVNSSFSGYLFQSDGQVGAVLTTEINSQTDARLASTSVKAHGTGLPGAGGITTDILGHARNPYLDDVGAYSAGGVTPVLTGGTQYIVTSGPSWTVPSTCTGPHNRIEGIGGGGPGGTPGSTNTYNPGGGGGEYAAYYGYPFTSRSPGTSVPVSVAGSASPGTNGGNTTFGSVLVAAGGAAGLNGQASAAGGMGGSGMVLHDGGYGGYTVSPYAGSGGGGAGGRTGPGAAGGRASSQFSGSGGGGGDGGAPGAATTSNSNGSPGGAGTGGTPGISGSAGGSGSGGAGGVTGGGGGGGGAGYPKGPGGSGGAGGVGNRFAPASGPGGGGGGGGVGGGGGAGGGYGGGGGASGNPALPGANGGPGILVVTCAP